MDQELYIALENFKQRHGITSEYLARFKAKSRIGDTFLVRELRTATADVNWRGEFEAPTQGPTYRIQVARASASPLQWQDLEIPSDQYAVEYFKLSVFKPQLKPCFNGGAYRLVLMLPEFACDQVAIRMKNYNAVDSNGCIRYMFS